ncbi:MAG: barstar family protein [Geminicoccaceae bacterium]|nr:barstar family protein [Geminicoccaceae bacterium]MCB9943393.1 barstar family protein [Geminicoccaceae bacterium]
MKISRLDGRQRSKRAVMRRLARDLDFPAHFSGSLDALFDVLTGDVKGPLTIHWRPTDRARTTMGADYDRLVATLEDAARERKDITLDLIA